MAQPTQRPIRLLSVKRWGRGFACRPLSVAADIAAQTWVGTTGSFTTSSNRDPATVPGTGAAAIFADTGVTSVTGAIGTIGGIQFDNNAQSYTIALDCALGRHSSEAAT
jgi:hypothetical protein